MKVNAKNQNEEPFNWPANEWILSGCLLKMISVLLFWVADWVSPTNYSVTSLETFHFCPKIIKLRAIGHPHLRLLRTWLLLRIIVQVQWELIINNTFPLLLHHIHSSPPWCAFNLIIKVIVMLKVKLNCDVNERDERVVINPPYLL